MAHSPENPIRVAAVGACYVDVNAFDFPLTGAEEEVGGDYEGPIAGGSAVNCLRTMGALGIQPVFIGTVGADPYGRMMPDLLREAGIEPHLIVNNDHGVKTNHSFNVTSPEGKHSMRVVGSANSTLEPTTVLAELDALFPQLELLYLGGCLKLVAFKEAFDHMSEMALRHHRGFAVDHGRVPAGTTAAMLDAVRRLVTKADLYFPSIKEFIEVWDWPGATPQAAMANGLETLHNQTQLLTVVVKDGANGAYAWDEDKLLHVPTQEIAQPKNLTGAGDSFNAGVIAAIKRGLPLKSAIEAGHRVATAHITEQPITETLLGAN